MLESDPDSGGITSDEAFPSDVEHRFLKLAAKWKEERGPHSSSAKLCGHPAYLQIVEMGPAVVPLLFRELERAPDHWFRALQALTGANPVPERFQGNIRAMAQAWLSWGRDHGYRW
jgi:hypothetical protein